MLLLCAECERSNSITRVAPFWWIGASRARTSFSRVFSLKLSIVSNRSLEFSQLRGRPPNGGSLPPPNCGGEGGVCFVRPRFYADYVLNLSVYRLDRANICTRRHGNIVLEQTPNTAHPRRFVSNGPVLDGRRASIDIHRPGNTSLAYAGHV